LSHTDPKEELKDLLINIPTLPFTRGRVVLSNKIYYADGYVYLKRYGGKKQNKYKVSTFFTTYKRLDDKMCREALENLKDYVLLLKLQRGRLQAKDIIECVNATIRHHLLASYGYENFFRYMSGEVIDRDGSSELIRLHWHRDEEAMVMVKVKDSTTHKSYLLRVPPEMRTCKQAIAWTFDLEEDEYEPLKEA